MINDDKNNNNNNNNAENNDNSGNNNNNINDNNFNVFNFLDNDSDNNNGKRSRKIKKDNLIYNIYDTKFQWNGRGHNYIWYIMGKIEKNAKNKINNDNNNESKLKNNEKNNEKNNNIKNENNNIFDTNLFLDEIKKFIKSPEDYFSEKIEIENISSEKNEKENGLDNEIKSQKDYDNDKLNGKKISNLSEKQEIKFMNFINNNHNNNDNNDNNNGKNNEDDFFTDIGYLPSIASTIINGKNIHGKSQISVEFAIQDGIRLITEFNARKEQIQLLSLFRTQSAPVKVTEIEIEPAKNEKVENEKNQSENENGNLNNSINFLSEEEFNSQFDEIDSDPVNTDSENTDSIANFGEKEISQNGGEKEFLGTKISKIFDVESIGKINTEGNEKTEIEIEVEIEMNRMINEKIQIEKIEKEKYNEQLARFELRASILSVQRAERTVNLLEAYGQKVRRNKINDNLNDMQNNRDTTENRENSQNRENGDDDGISMEDTEMLFYLQNTENENTEMGIVVDNSIYADENNTGSVVGDRGRSGSGSGSGSSSASGSGSKSVGGSKKGGTYGVDSKYSFSFDDSDTDSVLGEGEYHDDLEQSAEVETKARKASGQYRYRVCLCVR